MSRAVTSVVAVSVTGLLLLAYARRSTRPAAGFPAGGARSRDTASVGAISCRADACDNPVGFAPVRRGSIVQLVVIGIVVAVRSRRASRSSCRGCRSQASKRGGPDRLHLLVRDRDLAVRVRGRRGGPHLLADQLPRQGPGRLVGRAADPRPHDARDRLDDHPDDPRHRDLHRQRDRARAEQQRRARTRSRSRSSAQQFAWQFSYAERQDLPRCSAFRSTATVAARASRRTTSSTPSGCRSSRRSRTLVPGHDTDARDHAEPGSASCP